MNHPELVKQIAKRIDISQTETEKVMGDFIAIITQELLSGNSISFMNFGTFEVQKKNERVTMHPSTGKKILVPPKLVLKFKPAIVLNKKIKSIEP